MNTVAKTFDTFVQDPSNQFAAAACKAIAANPGTSGNPLWIYGPSGCGKSHLLGAICHELPADCGLTVCAMRAKEATDVLLALIDGNKAPWEQMKTCDVLLIDDMDFWSGKSTTQSEFARLFLSKSRNGQQVVLTSGCPPVRLATLAGMLRKQSETSLLAHIAAPTADLRREIAAKYLLEQPFPLTQNALAYLIEHTTSVPQLKGALNAARFRSQNSGRKINLWWAKHHVDILTR